MYMDGTDETLTEEQKQALLDKEKEPDLTDEQLEKILQKKFGAGSKDLIKKSEQTVVLSEAEKLELEEKKNSAALEWGLTTGATTKKEYDSYLEATKSDKVEYARKKYVAAHPELGEEAAKTFDRIFRTQEDDEVETDEVMVPNEDKKAALLLAQAIADEEINSRYQKVRDLPKRYEEHLEKIALKTVNEQLIIKSIAEIPRQMPVEVEGVEYKIKFEDDDFTAAQEMVVKDALEKKGLTADEVKGAVALFLKTKNLDRIISEIVVSAVSVAVDKADRGKDGVVPIRKDVPEVADEKMKFLKTRGIPV